MRAIKDRYKALINSYVEDMDESRLAKLLEILRSEHFGYNYPVTPDSEKEMVNEQREIQKAQVKATSRTDVKKNRMMWVERCVIPSTETRRDGYVSMFRIDEEVNTLLLSLKEVRNLASYGIHLEAAHSYTNNGRFPEVSPVIFFGIDGKIDVRCWIVRGYKYTEPKDYVVDYSCVGSDGVTSENFRDFRSMLTGLHRMIEQANKVHKQ